MRVSLFLPNISIQVGRSESDDDIDEEDEVDDGVEESDGVASDDGRTVLVVEDGNGDTDGVIHGQKDDHVVPVFYEDTGLSENELTIRGSQRNFWLLICEKSGYVRLLGLLVIFHTGLAIYTNL